MAAVMEGWGMSTNGDAHLAVGHGWEVNTGSFAVRRSASGLLRTWLKIFKDHQDKFTHFLTGEQQGIAVYACIHIHTIYPMTYIT